ncbi:MAG TPA: STAS domain-containing protein [Terriglobia bacterium]|nr:STAS domain-containing protein [Terriglobia bacterium]
MKSIAFNYYMHDGPAAFSIELAGALTMEGAKKLEQDWSSASMAIGQKELVVDLSFVTEIGPEGRQLLLRWRRNGARVSANTPESRALVESTIGRRVSRIPRIAYTSKPYWSGLFLRNVLPMVGMLALLIPARASAQRLPLVQPINIVSPATVQPGTGQPTTTESIAFARYIAWLQRDPFTGPGPVALAIEGSLPGLDKQGSLLAIRQAGEFGRSQSGILELQGDSIAFERVIAPYLAAQGQAEDLPRSSVLITPQNYKFHYAGAVETADHAAYIFRITPKKNRAGLIRGELWIEPLTGAPVLVSGYLVKTPSTSIRRVTIVREVTFVDGNPGARLTHMMIETRPVGREELTIIELPLRLPDRHERPPSISMRTAL